MYYKLDLQLNLNQLIINLKRHGHNYTKQGNAKYFVSSTFTYLLGIFITVMLDVRLS